MASQQAEQEEQEEELRMLRQQRDILRRLLEQQTQVYSHSHARDDVPVHVGWYEVRVFVFVCVCRLRHWSRGRCCSRRELLRLC